MGARVRTAVQHCAGGLQNQAPDSQTQRVVVPGSDKTKRVGRVGATHWGAPIYCCPNPLSPFPLRGRGGGQLRGRGRACPERLSRASEERGAETPVFFRCEGGERELGQLREGAAGPRKKRNGDSETPVFFHGGGGEGRSRRDLGGGCGELGGKTEGWKSGKIGPRGWTLRRSTKWPKGNRKNTKESYILVSFRTP